MIRKCNTLRSDTQPFAHLPTSQGLGDLSWCGCVPVSSASECAERAGQSGNNDTLRVTEVSATASIQQHDRVSRVLKGCMNILKLYNIIFDIDIDIYSPF